MVIEAPRLRTLLNTFHCLQNLSKLWQYMCMKVLKEKPRLVLVVRCLKSSSGEFERISVESIHLQNVPLRRISGVFSTTRDSHDSPENLFSNLLRASKYVSKGNEVDSYLFS